MTKREQKRIAREILADLRITIFETFKRKGSTAIPAEWNGFELRLWIRDTLTERYVIDRERAGMNQARLRDYNNARMVRGL